MKDHILMYKKFCKSLKTIDDLYDTLCEIYKVYKFKVPLTGGKVEIIKAVDLFFSNLFIETALERINNYGHN